MRNLRIDGERLWHTLMEMAKIGATEKGGNCRLALTDLDAEGRNLFIGWAKQAGCEIRVDEVGNVFARRPGRKAQAPAIMTGSHLDTQPTGGRFDGVLGVLAGLEVIRSLNDAQVETDAPIEVVCWTNEEGSRFSPAMMGSGVYAGVFEREEVYDKRAQDDGARFGDELDRLGFKGDVPAGAQPPGRYFELHIEQGPILEAEEKTIGVVMAAQGQRWFEINFTGQEAHAGPTPMAVRKDALVAAARMVTAVNRIGHDFQPYACATCGVIESRPNSRNVIPGRVFLTVDLRHPEADRLDAMGEALKAEAATIEAGTGVEVGVTDFWHFPPTPFDAACVDLVRQGAEIHGLPMREIVSGAGHDAIYVSKLAPTGMIFIPCEGGISHNEIENADPAHCTAGANVLLHAMVESAGVAIPADA